MTTMHIYSFDSSVGRAEDCSSYVVILRSLVRIRLEGILSFYLFSLNLFSVNLPNTFNCIGI